MGILSGLFKKNKMISLPPLKSRITGDDYSPSLSAKLRKVKSISSPIKWDDSMRPSSLKRIPGAPSKKIRDSLFYR